MDVQAGRVGHYDRERLAIVWKPEHGRRGSQTVEAALSAPGWEPIVLTKIVAVADRPGLEVVGIVAAPDIDRDEDGIVNDGDELIELHNAGADETDLSGWTLGVDDGSARYTFPTRSEFHQGDTLRILGSAAISISGPEGRSGHGLESGGRILLIAPAGPDTVVDVTYRSRGETGLLRRDEQDLERWVAPAPTKQVADDRIGPSPPDESAGVMRIAPRPVRGCADVSIKSELSRSASIKVYNTLGQTVSLLFDGYLEAGSHAWQWCPSARGLSAGTYFITDTRAPQAGVVKVTFIY
jgi:hypothetical protein